MLVYLHYLLNKNVPYETFYSANITLFIQTESHMKDEAGKLSSPPRHGYISELAAMCKCNRKTVTRALFNDQQGRKSDEVRAMFKKLFIGE